MEIISNRDVVLKETGGDFEYTPIPEGQHMGRLVSITELGTHLKTFSWKEKEVNEIRLCFELYPQDADDEFVYQSEVETKDKDWNVTGIEKKPFLLFKTYTNSLSGQARLRQDLESWRGKSFTDEELKGFHVKKCLWIGALISIEQNEGKDKNGKPNGKTYSNMKSISRLPKIMVQALPEMLTKPYIYAIGISQSDFEDDQKEGGIFDILGERTVEKIKESKEYKTAMEGVPEQMEKEAESEIEKALNKPSAVTPKTKNNENLKSAEDVIEVFQKGEPIKDDVDDEEDF